MGYSWFRVDSALPEHPKVLALAAELEEPLSGWYVIRLWSWAQRYAADGRVNPAARAQLEAAIGWRGAVGELIQAMIKTELLDEETDALFVHDWEEHQSSLVQKSVRDAALKRKKRREAGAKTARAEKTAGASNGRTYETDVRTNVTDLPTPAALAELWNEVTTTPLPRVTLKDGDLSGARQKAARAALQRRPLEEWRRVFTKANASNFCRGSDGGWIADFDWAIRDEGKKPEPALKLLEGSYDRAATPAAKGAAPPSDWKHQKPGDTLRELGGGI